MRARYKDPNGTGVVEIDDNATVGTLFEALKAKTSFDHFTVKYGPPASMHNIDMDQIGVIAKSLGLHGETLTIVPSEIPIPLRRKDQPNNPTALESSIEDCIIPWPERVGNIVLRVVPSDNSCLFTAFGGALPGHFQSDKLRQMMADYIAEHPELYSEAVLGCAPVEYQHTIRNPDRWGGGIELSILSTIFDIEICTFDVQGQYLINFGEEKKNRCILIYSGIHYDRVAFSSSAPDTDITIWPTTDSEILEKTRLLVRKLNAGQYYTDTQGLALRCDKAGCGWIGNGQLAAKQHADLTGHVDMTEIPDLDEDDVLRMCSMPGCNFIGQGKRAIVQHKGDTGHCKFDIIPDM